MHTNIHSFLTTYLDPSVSRQGRNSRHNPLQPHFTGILVFPGQMGYFIPPAGSGSTSLPGKPLRQGNQEASKSDAWTTTTSLFQGKGAVALL